MEFLQTFSTGGFTLDTLLKFTDLDARVQKRVQKVYATLAAALLVCCIGAWTDMVIHIGGVFTGIAGFFCMLGLSFTPSNPSTLTTRYGLLAGIAFLQGCTIAPLLKAAFEIHPPLILTALFLTLIVFGSFSGAALISKRRSMLYLASFCSIGILGLSVLRISSVLFGGSVFAFQMDLFFGLLIFAVYVLVDTQVLVERASMADFDHIKASLQLLLDFINIFVRILIILARKEQEREKNDNRRRRKA